MAELGRRSLRCWAVWTLVSLLGAAVVTCTDSQADPDPPTVKREAAVDLPRTRTALRIMLTGPHDVVGSLRNSSDATSATDRWMARDKAQHVVFSGLWTLSSQYVFVNKIDLTEDEALPLSVASSASVGVAKELYDASRPTGQVSGKDLVANAVGIGLAVGVIFL